MYAMQRPIRDELKPRHARNTAPKPNRLTVRLLEPGPGTFSTELLRLAPPVVRYQQSPVILHQGLLELVLGVLVNVLLVVGNLSQVLEYASEEKAVQTEIGRIIQLTWRLLVGWRRLGMCVHHQLHERGCRRWLSKKA